KPTVHSTGFITIRQMRAKFELADAITLFGSGLLAQTKLTPLQQKVLGKIAWCRTAALGGHEEVCESCGTVRYSYNSCGDRHCPKCQAAKQVFWIDDLMQNTLPIKHYHIIFTLPHQLNAVCLHNQRLYYDLLFAAAWNTLHSFGYSHFGVETGTVAVLHTWGQNLSLHPHIHCIVPAAGYALDGQWKNIGHSGTYLYPVHQLSDAFKGKFLDSLKRALRKQNELLLFNDKVQEAYKTRWVVHCEPSLASAEHVVKYLGQYTHRVAITNQRILNITDSKVTFLAKDYRDRAAKKQVTLDGTEFLRRFSMHILPKRFVKIRRFGIYNPTLIRNHKLKFISEEKPDIQTIIKNQKGPETNLERLERLTGVNPCLCPVCKTGRMITVRELPRIRSPDLFFLKQPQLQS
ncbi:MAG: IS91 family transposase, partial [Bacteroidales bacterium]|nr:IS91 family transposase [Bacteroidales bacterium]